MFKSTDSVTTYCYGHQVDKGGEIFDCPEYPFRLQAMNSPKVNELVHRVKTEQIWVSDNGAILFTTLILGRSPGQGSWLTKPNVARSINSRQVSSADSNNRLDRAGLYILGEQYGWAAVITALASTVFLIRFVVCLLIWFRMRRSGPDSSPRAPSELINVISTGQPVLPAPQSYPALAMPMSWTLPAQYFGQRPGQFAQAISGFTYPPPFMLKQVVAPPLPPRAPQCQAAAKPRITQSPVVMLKISPTTVGLRSLC